MGEMNNSSMSSSAAMSSESTHVDEKGKDNIHNIIIINEKVNFKTATSSFENDL
jgi:hypothetical protein